MGTPLGLRYIPYTYMDPLGWLIQSGDSWVCPARLWPLHLGLAKELSGVLPGGSECLGFRV